MMLHVPAKESRLRFAICDLSQVVGKQAEVQDLRKAYESSNEESDAKDLGFKKGLLRTKAIAIIAKLVDNRYDVVLDSSLIHRRPLEDEFVKSDNITVEVTKLLAQTRKAEQDGAVQPATRSESDSEGGDKPQPESKGRSR